MKNIEQEELNKALVIHYYKRIDDPDLNEVFKMIDFVVAKDYVCHSASHHLEGVESLKDHIISFSVAFKDATHIIETNFAEGNLVATRCIFKAVHKGEFMGIPPSGKRIAIPMLYINKVENHRIKETWTDWDSFYILKQRYEALNTYNDLHFE